MNISSGKKGPKAVISGYYGFDNCGDEAVLLAIINLLKKIKPDARITVLSGKPKKTRETYAVGAVNRWNPFAIALELLSCRLLISGGGSLLQDVTSTNSLRYYLAVINMANLLRKKTIIYSQGIGPLSVKKNRTKVCNALNRCNSITVRDGGSAQLLRELGITRDIHVTCDPVMALRAEDVCFEEINADLREIGISGNDAEKRKPLIVAAIRAWGGNSHIKPVSEFLDKRINDGWDVLLLPAHYPDDTVAMNEICHCMAEKPYLLDKCLTAREFLALTARADMVFSMRLHGLICALAVGTPMLGISYDPKVGAFMEQAGLEEYCLPCEDFTCEAAEQLFEELESFSPNPQEWLEERRREMRGMAAQTAQKAAELLT